MSNVTIELHAIIKSMTPNQKRNFTLNCKANSNSLVLFNAFYGLEKYNKEELVKYLQKNGKSNVTNNLARELNVLYEIVIKIFMTLTSERSIAKQLRYIFDKIVFLQERGFFVKSPRMLKKLRNDAYDYDQKTLLLDICKYERRMIRNGFEHKGFNSIQEIKKMEQELTKSLNLEVTLRDIYDDVFSLRQNINILKKSEAKTQLNEIEAALNKIDQEQCTSFNTKVLYLNSMAVLYELKLDKEAVFKCMDEMQKAYEAHKNASKASDFTYTKFLANYLYYLVKYDKSFKQFSTILTKIKSIKIDTLYEKVINFSDVDYLEFVYYLKQGDFKEMESQAPVLIDGLEKYNGEIETGRQITIWQNLLICYFLKEDFDTAHSYIQKILDQGKNRRIDLFYNSKIFQLLVHYELGEIKKLDDIDFLRDLTEKVKNSFKDAGYSNELVDLITKLMKTRCKKTGLEKKDFEAALEQFNEIDKSKNPNLPYDEIEIWLKSKIEKQPMQKIAEQMLQNKNNL